MENPILSIITPVYNVEKYLPDCIRSIREQSFPHFELILVDDGSPDECGAICDAYALRDSRIRVIHQPNQGLSAARNRALEAARGEYITFIDSDDTVSADALGKNMGILQKDAGIDVLEYPIFVYYGAPEAKLWRKGPHAFTDHPFEEWFRQKGYQHMYACNKIFKRALFHEIRFPEGKIFEDIYTIPKLLKNSSRYFISDLGIYYYHAREGSISRQESFEQYRALFESNYSLWEMVKHERGMETEAGVFLLEVADWLIAMGRKDAKKTKQLLAGWPHLTLSPGELVRMPVPVTRKLKNMPWALFGIKLHYLIYTRIK